MKKMLINATEKEEIRVALVDGHFLYDLHIESSGVEQTKSNIYKGRVTKLAPSLDAAFVDYGGEKHGFLPLKEVACCEEVIASGKQSDKLPLREGQDILVQVCKGERGSKGAALTTFISLAGSYLVLMPNNPKAAGISRRVEGDERQTLKSHMSNLHAPPGMGLIVRTAGVNRSEEELAWDLETLLRYWEAIQVAANRCTAPCLIHQEGNLIARAIRDFLRRDIEKIIVDERDTFERVKEKIALLKPEFLERIAFYDSNIPLFNHFQIAAQIESAFQREVRLSSGGSLILDTTEALTAIDVNSARSTKGGDIEETALHTNLEAAGEIARQLRLRDAGGLVVVDFIDMHSTKHQQMVECKMREAVQEDRARIQIGHISKFGLLELSRQRLRPSLRESSPSNTCPRCNGTGMVRGNESLAISILRLIEATAARPKAQTICALVPLEIGTYLLNEKRGTLARIESLYSVKILVLPDHKLQPPQYQIHCLSQAQMPAVLSYQLPKELDKAVFSNIFEPSHKQKNQAQGIVCEAPVTAVLSEAHLSQLTQKREAKRPLLKRIWHWFLGSPSSPTRTSFPSTPTVPTDASEPAQMTCASKKAKKLSNKRVKPVKELKLSEPGPKTILDSTEVQGSLQDKIHLSRLNLNGIEATKASSPMANIQELRAVHKKNIIENEKNSEPGVRVAADGNTPGNKANRTAKHAKNRGSSSAGPGKHSKNNKERSESIAESPKLNQKKLEISNTLAESIDKIGGAKDTALFENPAKQPQHKDYPLSKTEKPLHDDSVDRRIEKPIVDVANAKLLGSPLQKSEESTATESHPAETLTKDLKSFKIGPMRCHVGEDLVQAFLSQATETSGKNEWHLASIASDHSAIKQSRDILGRSDRLPLGNKLSQKFAAQPPNQST